MTELDSDKRDYFASILKGTFGAFPLLGPMASEAIGRLIPGQRLDRVVEFLRQMENEVQGMEERIKILEKNIKTDEGLDIFEEGLTQAARSYSKERQERLARLVSQSLTAEKIKHAESKKLLNLFRELTDPEVLWLVYYSTDPTIGSQFHKQLIEDSPEVLKPVSREIGSSQDQIDRAALQDSYKNTLFRFGLIKEHGRSSYQITSLGRLLVRYIAARKEKNEGEWERNSNHSGYPPE
ncbi:MAG: hypothetical protein ACOC90_09240 [Bacteroidota bacterium]